MNETSLLDHDSEELFLILERTKTEIALEAIAEAKKAGNKRPLAWGHSEKEWGHYYSEIVDDIFKIQGDRFEGRYMPEEAYPPKLPDAKSYGQLLHAWILIKKKNLTKAQDRYAGSLTRLMKSIHRVEECLFSDDPLTMQARINMMNHLAHYSNKLADSLDQEQRPE